MKHLFIYSIVVRVNVQLIFRYEVHERVCRDWFADIFAVVV